MNSGGSNLVVLVEYYLLFTGCMLLYQGKNISSINSSSGSSRIGGVNSSGVAVVVV